MNTIARLEVLLASLLLSLGLAAAGYFVGNTLYNAKVGINTAEVKGLAERRVEADRAYCPVHSHWSGQSRRVKVV